MAVARHTAQLTAYRTGSFALRAGKGRPRRITSSMLEAPFDYLIEKQTLYQDEIAFFL